MKKTVIFCFLVALAFFSFAAFYITTKFKAPAESAAIAPAIEEVKKSPLKKAPSLKKPVSVSKKVYVNGCIIKDDKCTCYTKDGNQLNPSLSICENYIKSSGGSQVIFLENFNLDELDYLNDLLSAQNALSNNRSAGQR